jgi:hypothetical protein
MLLVMKVTISLFGLLAVLLTMPASAQGIYKWEDENGQTHYSDVPQEGAIEIELRPVQTFAAPAVKSTATEDRSDNKKKQGYDALEISSPGDEETIWNTGGTISVNLQVSPALKPGHLIVLYLDGKLMAQPAQGTSAQLTEVSRGTHALQAVLLDAKGKQLIKSRPITFFSKQATADAGLIKIPKENLPAQKAAQLPEGADGVLRQQKRAPNNRVRRRAN